MTQPIISVDNLGKSYLIGHQSAKSERYTALRDIIGRSVKSFGRKTLDMAWGRQIIQGDDVEEFWALSDVSFEVGEGEVVGVIGRNGAGKSTLLKILSRITEPTKGRVTLRGRVASLLEVGTGFHPELTGRENIFLNGAILGMTRVEIKQKFDQIVDFAGVEKFLDTPVKRYSSGMYVRLAFAVAAHLDPEILVVDEVLAVGDAEFQRKCLGKLKDVASGGRTVLFVSHNLPQIEVLCEKCLLLNKGEIEFFGETESAVSVYQESPNRLADTRTFQYIESATSNEPKVKFADPLEFRIHLKNLKDTGFACNLVIQDNQGQQFSLFSTQPHDGFDLPNEDCLEIRFRIEECRYPPGEYWVDIEVTDPRTRVIERARELAQFSVLPELLGGTWAYTSEFGSYFPKHSWEVV